MRALWITNVLFPDISDSIGMTKTPYGGWMYSSAKELIHQAKDFKLAVATVSIGKEFIVKVINGITYYVLPISSDITKYHKSLEYYWKKIKSSFNPDIVHIHGTEFPHGLAYIRACGSDNVCISIQGLVSIYARYYFAGISFKDICRNITLRDIVKLDTLFHQKRKYERRGEFEKEYIRTAKHLVGRTTWDRAHIWAINPEAQYHFCNETLRPVFYKYEWEYDKCEKHTIFLSQASYPIKGLHRVLEAMPLILRQFPDTKLKIAGNTIIDKPYYKISGYGKYIRSLIKKLRIDNNVLFLGVLDEEQMCEQYLKANVFVCPSSIENSPNSLGEAQLLGVPCLTSYVGGAMDMMVSENGLYRFEEVETLALKICNIFETNYVDVVNDARQRHSKEINASRLLEIYSIIN